MGNYWPSQTDDVPSIHKSSTKTVDVGETICDVCVKGAQVVLENLKELSTTLSPVGTIGGKFASVLLLSVFDGLTEKMDLKKLLGQIKDTVHDELTELAVDKVEGTVQGLKLWVSVELPNRTAPSANWSPEDIWKDFYPKVDRLREDLDMLMTQRFKETHKGLTMFILAASLHLAMLQDLASMDYRVKDWRDSVHFADLKKRAIVYAEHAESATTTLLEQRAEKVKARQAHKQTNNPFINYVEYRWVDEETGQYSYWMSISFYEERVEAVKERLYVDLGRPREVAERWRSMA